MRSKFDNFSDDQAITVTAVSTNYVDVGKFAGKGEPIEMEVSVTEDFATLTSLTVDVAQCATVAGSYVVIETYPTVVLASLVAGYKFKINFLPDVNHRYIKLNYTVVGSDATAGTIAAEIVAPGGVDESFEDGLYFSPRNPTGAASTA